MNGVAVAIALVAVGAPAPEPLAARYGPVDRTTAEDFARVVNNLAAVVAEKYAREEVTQADLVAAAVRGLYEEAGLPVPETLTADARKAAGVMAADSLMAFLRDARIRLGNDPKLAGLRSLFAAINGFRHATDSLCILVSPRLNTYASVEQDFGIGIELEGVAGPRWTMYQAECAIASRRFPPMGYFGPIPKLEDIACPAVLPWRVKRVVPGSPAQRNGVKAGDAILQLEGAEISAQTANRLFTGLTLPRFAIDPQTGRPASPEWRLTLQREQQKPFEVVLKVDDYTPESAFGVIRTDANTWDCMLDRKARIGYIRLGPIETGLDETVKGMVTDLVNRQCRGLILDLRWCPGGYIDPARGIAGLFLREGTVLAKMKYRSTPTGTLEDWMALPGSGTFFNLPMVVLVGQETIGGGELLAAAFRDNNRCVVIGQRTVGRASIQNTVSAGFAGVQYKITTGASFRPNGRNRQRLPDSRPTDDWGIKPDAGFAVPITLDKSKELHRQADEQALRPFDNHTALPYDDPYTDPYRLAALEYFRRKLGDGN